MYNHKKDMTKKAWQELQKSHRATTDMNTGTRDMKSSKYLTRAQEKEKIRQEVKKYGY